MPSNFPMEVNLIPKTIGCHKAGPGHLPQRGVRGRADQEGEAGGAEGPAWGGGEDRGAGREGGGLRRGAGSAEPQDRGEVAASPGAGRPALPSRGREGEAAGHGYNSGKTILNGKA